MTRRVAPTPTVPQSGATTVRQRNGFPGPSSSTRRLATTRLSHPGFASGSSTSAACLPVVAQRPPEIRTCRTCPRTRFRPAGGLPDGVELGDAQRDGVAFLRVPHGRSSPIHKTHTKSPPIATTSSTAPATSLATSHRSSTSGDARRRIIFSTAGLGGVLILTRERPVRQPGCRQGPEPQIAPAHAGDWRNRCFNPAVKALGLTGPRRTPGRHTYISLQIHAGVSPVTVAALAGNSPRSSGSTTPARISSLPDDRGRPLAEAFQAARTWPDQDELSPSRFSMRT